MAAPKYGKRLAAGDGFKGKSMNSRQVDFLVWSDIIDGVSAIGTAKKLTISRQAVEQRRAKLRAFIDPDGTLLPVWRAAVGALAVAAMNTLHYHLVTMKDKELAIRILENVKALEVANATQPSAGGSVSVQQYFTGLGQVPDADRNRIRSGLATAFGDTAG